MGKLISPGCKADAGASFAFEVLMIAVICREKYILLKFSILLILLSGTKKLDGYILILPRNKFLI